MISSNNDYRDTEDDHLYSIGNYGLTKEELESKLKYDIARQVLLDDAKGGKWKKDGSNYCAYYDYDEDDWSKIRMASKKKKFNLDKEMQERNNNEIIDNKSNSRGDFISD